MKLPPRRSPDDPRCTPILLRRDLLALGWDDRLIRRHVQAGELTRIRHGAYVATREWKLLDRVGQFVVRGRAVVRAANTGCVLSHVSAAAEYGAPMWGIDLSRIHVTRTDGRSGRRAVDVVQHEAHIDAASVVILESRLVSAPARAVLESLTCVSAEAGLCLANHLLHHGYTTRRELEDEYVGMENWQHSRGAEIVLRLADPRPESVGESRIAWVCFQAGLPKPIPQYEVRDETGRVVARVDFAWPELGVFLEFDGRVKYESLLKPGERASDVVIRERDRERLICRLTGWRCVRATWADLERPARRIAELCDAMQYPLGA